VRNAKASIALALLSLTIGCSPDSSPEQLWTAADMLGGWQLISLAAEGEDLAVSEVSMTYDGWHMSGWTPCGRYDAEVQVTGQHLRIGEIVQQGGGLSSCPSGNGGYYLPVLGEVTAFTFDSGALVLIGPTVLIRFKRMKD